MSRRLLVAALASALGLLAAAAEPAPPTSIHQSEWEAHRRELLPAEPPYALEYVVRPGDSLWTGAPVPSATTRTVYGFMPSWVVSDLSHVRWDLLTHVAYFSVPLNADGSLGTTGWPGNASVAALISTAHANGVKVTLAATNFTAADITTLLSSAAYRQNAVNNLLAKVQAGGGDGVNIDLEGVPAAQKANLVTFMQALSTAFHGAIPGSHVSLDTPAVDWSSGWDYPGLAAACDGLFIMGYDYHWSGASTAGPCAPLTGGATWGTYTVTWTVNDYVTKVGTTNKGKLILGVPYYGYVWATASTAVPSSTTATGSSQTYDAARANAAAYGRLWDAASQTPYFTYTTGGPHQGWYDDAQSLGLKWDLVNAQDLGGTGMWALNYDKSDDLLWSQLAAKFTAGGGLAGVKIGVDPGHGGTDTGAVGPTGLTEKEVNLATSLMLRDALEAEGATCYLTRTTDVTVSLAARTDYFNSIPVDRSESCHYNACGNCGANYTGVHVYANTLGQCVASATSKDMAAKTALRLDAALAIGVVSSNCDAIYGVHGDNFAMVRDTAMPAMLTESAFLDNAAEEVRLRTDARRCLIAGAVAKGIEDHLGAAASEPPCAGGTLGTCANPIAVSAFPYTDNNTTSGKGASLNGYVCPPSSGSEAGPEVVYQVTVPAAGLLGVTVTDGTSVDVDPHLLSACTPSACLARADTSFTQYVRAGSYTLVCDTWTSAGGTSYPGAYTLNVTFSPDVTPPDAVAGLLWSGASGGWEWTAVTRDQLGGAEVVDHYEVYRNAVPSGAGSLLVSPAATSWTDPSTPAAGCWFYQVRAVDAAGLRDRESLVDNPDAVFTGSWSTGTATPGHWGADYRYANTGGAGTGTATWSFTPPERGNYAVAVYYPSGANRSTAARFTVAHAGGSTLVPVNQQSNGGTWVSLGTFWMEAGTAYAVTLDDAEPAGFVVIADAVRWSKVL